VHVNQPPTASAQSPVYVNRGVQSAITISVSDPDTYDTETFTITNLAGLGSFADSSNTTISTPYNLATVNVQSSNAATQTIYYTSPYNSANPSTFSFTVTDAGGLTSSTFAVTISIL
jgi:hypothetical protein